MIQFQYFTSHLVHMIPRYSSVKIYEDLNMKTKLKSILAMTTLALGGLWLSTQTLAETSLPRAVERVDLEKYAGTWYEIAHLPLYFQRHCAANVTAQYTVNTNQTMQVVNSCLKADGKMLQSEAVAYPQNTGNSQLKVSFLPKGLRWLPFTKGDYWILRLDPDYKVALVGGPSQKYLWILSRDREIDDETYQSYLATAKQYGYDVSKLIQLPHQP